MGGACIVVGVRQETVHFAIKGGVFLICEKRFLLYFLH
jgi:hypothetical protein